MAFGPYRAGGLSKDDMEAVLAPLLEEQRKTNRLLGKAVKHLERLWNLEMARTRKAGDSENAPET